MKLISDMILNTENTTKLMDLFYNCFTEHSDGKLNFYFVSFDEFKNIIHKFIIETMGLFLCNSKFRDDEYDVCIKDFPISIHGVFSDNNKLYINKKIIRNLYDGDLEKFISILHELNHFKVKYDILSGVINLDICRIVKENLLRDEDIDPFNEIGSYKSLKDKKNNINDFYYQRNYNNFSEEVYVNMCAKQDFITLIKILFINYNRGTDNNLSLINDIYIKLIEDDLIKYNDYNRDFSLSLSFNSNHLNFDDAFDISIKYHSQWLKYPQIGIEYYLDKDGYVKRKDINQLMSSMNEVYDIETKEYIQYLIENIKKKENTCLRI